MANEPEDFQDEGDNELVESVSGSPTAGWWFGQIQQKGRLHNGIVDTFDKGLRLFSSPLGYIGYIMAGVAAGGIAVGQAYSDKNIFKVAYDMLPSVHFTAGKLPGSDENTPRRQKIEPSPSPSTSPIKAIQRSAFDPKDFAITGADGSKISLGFNQATGNYEVTVNRPANDGAKHEAAPGVHATLG